MFITRSLTFYPGLYNDKSNELSDEIIIPSFYLNKIIERFEDNETLYVDMINTETNQSILVTIGTPHNYDKTTIFTPQWILDLIGCTGNCDSVIKIQKADMTDIPVATNIIIKPLDPIAFEINTLQCFETAFMNLHSIKEGITIEITVPELGTDYTMFAHIEKVEPVPLCRIITAEINVEFINDFKENIPIPITVPIPILNTNITDICTSSNTIITPIETPIELEERRRLVRESWLKRFDKPSINSKIS